MSSIALPPAYASAGPTPAELEAAAQAAALVQAEQEAAACRKWEEEAAARLRYAQEGVYAHAAASSAPLAPTEEVAPVPAEEPDYKQLYEDLLKSTLIPCEEPDDSVSDEIDAWVYLAEMLGMFGDPEPEPPMRYVCPITQESFHDEEVVAVLPPPPPAYVPTSATPRMNRCMNTCIPMRAIV